MNYKGYDIGNRVKFLCISWRYFYVKKIFLKIKLNVKSDLIIF